MELEIIELNTTKEYLHGMAECEDWMSYRLAKIAIGLCNEAGVEPTVSILTDYVSNHDYMGYLIEGKPNSTEFMRSLAVNAGFNTAMTNQANQEALSSWNNR